MAESQKSTKKWRKTGKRKQILRKTGKEKWWILENRKKSYGRRETMKYSTESWKRTPYNTPSSKGQWNIYFHQCIKTNYTDKLHCHFIAMDFMQSNELLFKVTWYLWVKNSKSQQLLDILTCRNIPSFQNPEKNGLCRILKRWMIS